MGVNNGGVHVHVQRANKRRGMGTTYPARQTATRVPPLWAAGTSVPAQTEPPWCFCDVAHRNLHKGQMPRHAACSMQYAAKQHVGCTRSTHQRHAGETAPPTSRARHLVPRHLVPWRVDLWQ